MGNSGLKQHIETAQKTGVLKLSAGKLNQFPPGFQQLEGCLRTLDLSDNKFVVLPPEISRFMQLRHLNLAKNKLSKLPDSIGALTRLETFNAGENTLSSIPRTFSNLIHLKQVILNGNQLRQFPTVFCGLKHLDLLDLSGNSIQVVPNDVYNLYVIELNLNRNEISSFSPEIANCPRLKTLRLDENCLTISAIHPRVLAHSQISNLSVEGNLFELKELANVEGYDAYMERFTAVKKKLF